MPHLDFENSNLKLEFENSNLKLEFENSNLKRKQHWRPCVHCHKCFNTIEELTIHVKIEHKGKRKCDFCNEMTTESEDVHMLKCNYIGEYIMG